MAPFVQGRGAVQIRQGDKVLNERVASANPPTVKLLTPNGGETLAPGVEVRWTASDPDGDPLNFTVQYSPDNGQTWQLIAMNVVSNSH